jgi:hypothetical protein
MIAHIQQSRYSKATASMIQGSLETTTAGIRLWHYPHDTVFEEGMQNARIAGVMEVSTQISMESLRGQALCARTVVPAGSP